MLITFALSVGAIVQPNHVTIGLVILNWALLLDAIGVVAVGSFIWFFSLQKRSNYEKIFLALSQPQRIAVQDKVRRSPPLQLKQIDKRTKSYNVVDTLGYPTPRSEAVSVRTTPLFRQPLPTPKISVSTPSRLMQTDHSAWRLRTFVAFPNIVLPLICKIRRTVR